MSIFNYKEKPGYFSKLKEALKDTTQEIGRQIGHAFGQEPQGPVTDDHMEDLEGALIGADIGVEASLEIIEKARRQTRGLSVVTIHKLRRIIRSEVLDILQAVETDSPSTAVSLRIEMVVGVNGVGKTTTIGKLAHLYQSRSEAPLICAADTFRAAAVEQLEIWSRRAGVDIVKQKSGADPAAVVFDAIAAGKARGRDVIIVDTAGRLHNKANLMAELEKMKRIAAREVEGAPHEVYLILDATTGQNGLVQAREFLKTSGVSGLIVTKLDGTAKGGIVVAVAKDLGIPIRYIGVGEQMGDLLPFSAEAYVDSLFGE